MAYEWLRPQDSTLWCAETDAAPLQVGALCLFEAGPLLDAHGRLRVADLRRHGDAALAHVPRLRQIMVRPPLGVGRPAWIDDPHFDPANHLRTATLPRPGGRRELRQFMRRVLETPLDRDRPLWEFWVVDGVEGGRVAIIPKFSHVAADGIAVLTFTLSLLDFEPDRHLTDDVEPWLPASPPGAARLFTGALVDVARSSVASVAGITAALARPDRLAVRAAQTVRAARAIAVAAPRLLMTRPVGPHRDFTWVSLPRDGLREVARARGVKLNDVVLALVADAMATGMTRAGMSREAAPPRVLVPVSTHVGDGSAGMANSFSFMIANLPVGDMSLPARLDLVHDETQRCKSSGQAGLAPMFFAIGNVIPPTLLRRVAPPVLRRQPFVNLAVTNLAGSPVPLYLLGSRMLEVYPFITLVGNIGMIVGVLSHDRQVGVGITVDPDLVDDVDTFAGDVTAAAAALVASVAGGPSGGPHRRPHHRRASSRPTASR